MPKRLKDEVGVSPLMWVLGEQRALAADGLGSPALAALASINSL